MLTNEDINNIVTAHKRLFYTKDEIDNKLDNKFAEIRQDISNLQTTVESFAVAVKTNSDEIKVVNQRVSDQGEWIKKAGVKIELEFKP